MNRQPLTVAVVGATGVVGRTMIQVLNEREFPVGELRLLASGRSAGRTVSVDGRTLEIGEAVPEAFDGVDIALFSAGADISRELAPAAVARGATVIDNSSAWRMDPTIPLVVSQVNPDDLEGHHGHHRQPELLDDAARAGPDGPARHASASSGSSSTPTSPCRAPAPTRSASSRARSGPTSPASRRRPRVYPHPIAFNALPEIDVFLDNGYTKEEWKVVTESRKILHLPDLRISCTAVRIPVFVSHSEAVHVETRDADHARSARASCSRPSRASSSRTTRPTHDYPLATEAAGRDEIFVGRVRQRRRRSPTAAASPSGSSPTTCARARRRTPSRSPRSCVERGWVRPAAGARRARRTSGRSEPPRPTA